MLTLFRRHLKSCKNRAKGRAYRACQCPLAVEGKLHGRLIRKSLDLRGWEAGLKVIRDWEIEGNEEQISVKEAWKRFIADCASRGVGAAQTGKYKLLEREMVAEFGELNIKAVSVDDVRRYRESWKLGAVTSGKKLERLRSFFGFCMDSGWIEKNPAKAIKPPQVEENPTLPYSEEDWKKILWALDAYGEIHPQCPVRLRKQLRALVLVMRYSGLRISDAVSLRRDRIDSKGRLFIRQEKTGHPVMVPLPKLVLNALKACDEGNPCYFWPGIGKLKTAITEWQDRVKKMLTIAGVPDGGIRGKSHRFRDSFAVDLLSRGVALETVSILLGHQNIAVTQKHYSPWVRSRQEALERAVRSVWNRSEMSSAGGDKSHD
jgi:integrase